MESETPEKRSEVAEEAPIEPAESATAGTPDTFTNEQPQAASGAEENTDATDAVEDGAADDVETSAADADSEGAEVSDSDEEAQAAPPSNLKWYAVNTYSGHENKARLGLLERIKSNDMEHRFGEVLVPTESVVEMVKGQRRTTTRKFYPGYMFVHMDLDEHTFHLVKNTPKITGFLGGNKPSPVKDEEIAGINRHMTEGAARPKPKISFDEGESIRVTDGPFSNFTGIVEEVRPEKQKVRVLVSIFGRATPVELDFVQVEKEQ